jgi:hypothetical protein
VIAKATDYFVQTLYTLRNKEEVVPYAYDKLIPAAQLPLATDFLEGEYDNECLHYPGKPPAFDAVAALWAAQIIYISAQLLLYRKDKEEDLPLLFPEYKGAITPAAMLSADLCLRFLPDVWQMAKNMDADDLLVEILDHYLTQWPYSAVGTAIDVTETAFELMASDPCLLQLYIDRIIARKDRAKAALPFVAPFVKAALGNFQTHFWKELG